MNKRQIKKDNSYFETKVKLRIDNLPDGNIKVLDCFGGSGRIWRRIKQELPDRDIQVLSIDQKKQSGVYLRGDNRKFLSSIDLSQFNIIDCDAYGVPYRQLKAIFTRQTRPGVVVFITFIQSIFGRMPIGLLRDVGYPAAMIRKCRSLFNRNGFSKFKLWLALNGIIQIRFFNKGQKYYAAFKIKKSQSIKSAGDWSKAEAETGPDL